MTSKELNLKLILAIPEIKKTYIDEISWQDGDDTGSHIVYADIFVPYIKRQIITNNDKTLVRIFDFIEELLLINDEYINEVVALSVFEPLVLDDEIDKFLFIKHCKEKSLIIVQEIINNILFS